MGNGAERYQAKAAAGISRTRADGSRFSADVDDVAERVEQWLARVTGGELADPDVHLSGDAGFDVMVLRGRRVVKLDAIHCGTMPDGSPRAGSSSSMIVNVDNNKLLEADILVLIEGPPFQDVGAIYTARFLALATSRDHGFGTKYSLPASRLEPLDRFLKVRRR